MVAAANATKTDVGATEWLIDDKVIRLRGWGTDRVMFQLPPPDRLPPGGLLVGSSEICAFRLVDPNHKVSREHARLVWQGERWQLRDNGSKNGLRLDGARRTEIQLEPGVEIGIGALCLFAESTRSIALRHFLGRLIGWTSDQVENVDLALRAVRIAAARRAPLVLCGKDDLVPIAQSLHRHALGDDKPFVLSDPRRGKADASVRLAKNIERGVAALDAAAGGTLCVWAKRLPKDFAAVRAAVQNPDSRVQIVVCARDPKDVKSFETPPIVLRPLAKREAEIDMIIDGYVADAATMLATETKVRTTDRAWIRQHSAKSLAEMEKAAQRLLAIRLTGSIAGAGAALGMTPQSLAEWFDKRRPLPPGVIS